MDSSQPQTLAITDEEVEQLLLQAESLVGAMAHDPDPAPGDPASIPLDLSPETVAPHTSTVDLLDDPAWADDVPPEVTSATVSAVESLAADPLQAIENTEAIAAELTAILDEAAEGVPPTKASDDETTFAAQIPGPPGASPSVAPGDVPLVILDEITDELTSVDVPNPEPSTTHEAATTEHLRPAAMTAHPAEPQPANDAPAQLIEPVARVPLKARLTAITRGAWFVLTAVPVALVNLVLRLIVLLDRPFARFSAETKLRIGLAALVTLFMGTAAWFLQRFAVQNPYAAMGP